MDSNASEMPCDQGIIPARNTVPIPAIRAVKARIIRSRDLLCNTRPNNITSSIISKAAQASIKVSTFPADTATNPKLVKAKIPAHDCQFEVDPFSTNVAGFPEDRTSSDLPWISLTSILLDFVFCSSLGL